MLRRRSVAWVRLGILLGFLFPAVPVAAHMMPAQQGTLNVLGSAVFVVLSVPVSTLSGVDDDSDGRASDSEVQRHQSVISAQVNRRFRLSADGLPAAEQSAVQEVVLIRAEPDDRSDASSTGAAQILVLLKTTFLSPPPVLRLWTDLFGSAAGEGQLTIRATRQGSQAEVAVLRPLAAEHRFFRSPVQLFADFLFLGIEHILLGADHLLFLLTVLVAAAGWRYWLTVLTSFTVAHCLSLTLALFGVIRLPARVVEPLIAASIVLMAVLNLRRTVSGPARRVAVVFACGLLHGLGFAAALGSMGVGGVQRLLSLLGFNLGIEAGQALFLLMLLTLSRLAPRRLPLAKWASIAALLLGTLWLIQRTISSVKGGS
jgi:hydrogenase/urease accessory protein HupE